MNVSNKIYTAVQRDGDLTQQQKDCLSDNLYSVTSFINLYVPDKQRLDFKRKNSIDSTNFKNRNLLDLIFNRDKTSVCYPQEHNILTGKFSIKTESEVSIDDYWSSFPERFALICE